MIDPRKHAGQPHRRSVAPLLDLLMRLLARLVEMQLLLHRGRTRKLKPWHLKVTGVRKAALSAIDKDQLLQRHRDLQDAEAIAEIAAAFQSPESDFFADPLQVERLIRRILAENPPWLHVARTLAGGSSGPETRGEETLWREQITRTAEETDLFVPDESWRDLPLASLTMRPTRRLDEVWHGRLLDQVLPPEVLVDRHNRGELMVPRYQTSKQRLEFRPERRIVQQELRRRVPVAIETNGGEGAGGQLLYVLLDFSASMQGKSATLALSVIAAALRANMGQRDTRYLFRRYADSAELWPSRTEPPLSASTVTEKDQLLKTIFSTNFNGGSTHVNDALAVAIDDVRFLRKTEQVEAEILLVTDGRAEMLEGTQGRLAAAGVKVHAVMVTPEANPGLAALSETFTTLNIDASAPSGEEQAPRPRPVAIPRRAFKI